MSEDRAVPGLFRPTLDRLRADAASYYGVADVQLTAVDWHDRPFSHLLRLAVRDEASNRTLSHLFVKVYKRKEIAGGENALRDRVAADFESTRAAYSTFASDGDLGAVPPVACYPDLLAIVTEQVDGVTLVEHLHHNAAWFPSHVTMQRLCETLERVGRWIRVYQTATSTTQRLTVVELSNYIDHRLGILVAHRGMSDSDRQAILAVIDRLAGEIPPDGLREVPIHADLALGNVLVAGSRVVVLDFAMAKLGTRLHDLTRLSVQMDLLTVKPQFRGQVIARLQRALLHGFDPSLTAEDPLFRLLSLLHRINHLTTLVVNRGTGAEALYNGLVRRRHRRWIEGERAARRELEPA